MFDTETASALRLWIVPAQVAGHWRWELRIDGQPRRFLLEMNQQFQRVSGLVSVGDRRLRLRDPQLRGAVLRFTLLEEPRPGHGVRYDYAGRVNGDSIEGELMLNEGEKRLRWVATRQERKASGPS